MKHVGLLILLWFAPLANAQVNYLGASTAFPHVAVGGDADGSNLITLVQIVNNNASFTTAHFTLFSDDGTPLPVLFDGVGPQSTFDMFLDSGQSRQIQLTRVGTLVSGWMQVNYAPASASATVVLQSRLGATLLSEVGVDPVVGTFTTIPTILSTDFSTEIDGALNTGIAVANPSSFTLNMLARLWDPNTGAVLASSLIAVSPAGHLARYLPDLFPGTSIGQMRAEVSLDSCTSSACNAIGGNGFIATVVRQNADQFTTIPVVQRPGGGVAMDAVRVLPQVAFGGPAGGLNLKTVLYFTTNVATGVFGTGEIFDDSGNPLMASADGSAPSSSFPFTVPGSRVTRVVLTGDQVVRGGWLRVTNRSGNVHLLVNAVFQTFNGSTLVSEAGIRDSPAVLPAAPLAPVTRGLIYVRIQSNANVGVALSNPQSTANTITLQLFQEAGFIAATKDITLPPNGHVAQFVTDIFPELNGVTNFDGALFMRSSTAFSAMALRLSGDKVATLPVALDGMFRPYISNVRVPSTQRLPAQVNFQIDVTDYDSDFVTAGATSLTGFSILDFGSLGSASGTVTADGSSLIGVQFGTVTGSFRPPGITAAIPAGTNAILYMQIYDSFGNSSNIVTIPIRF